MGFIRQHTLLGAAAAFSLLSPDLLDTGPFGGDKTVPLLLNAIEEKFTGQKPVQSLLPGFLAAHLEASRAMHQQDAGVDLVDVLAAVTAGAHEGLFEVVLQHSKLGHAAAQLGCLFRADRECAHGLEGNQFLKGRRRFVVLAHDSSRRRLQGNERVGRAIGRRV